MPSFSCSAAQPATTPGTVTASQPRLGCTASPSGPVPYLRLKYSTFHAAGATPDEFRPCNCRPSQTMAKQSPPSPQDTGSTSTMVAAAAMAASTALPPLSSIRRPACAASGCEVDTTLRAKTGMRVDGYGLTQLKAFI
ncbi:Uncharacterised protein [Bordetella pertussis]|nr:Uncharacterised protein [Bordetella pertussis]